MSIEVLKAGLWSSIQDKGRSGFTEYGVPKSGTMDKYAAGFANMILGNPVEAAVLEVTFIGPKLLFHAPSTVAVAGLGAELFLNDKSIGVNEAFFVGKGDVLEMKKTIKGSRMYLAVKGGFQTEKIMGSRSMFDGITKDIKIKKADFLPLKVGHTSFSEKNSSVHFNNDFYDNKIEVVPGPEFKLLPKSIQDILFNKLFTVSADSNRMAVVLNEKLENDLPNILTCPVLLGSVQLTPSGKVIILMRDAQVSGGYPRILQLKEKSINKLAQIKDEKIAFVNTGN